MIQVMKRCCLVGLLCLLGTGLVLGCSNERNTAYKPTASIQPVLPPDSDLSTDEGDTQRVCTMDVKQCPDGRFVSRDASAGCAFRACAK